MREIEDYVYYTDSLEFADGDGGGRELRWRPDDSGPPRRLEVSDGGVVRFPAGRLDAALLSLARDLKDCVGGYFRRAGGDEIPEADIGG